MDLVRVGTRGSALAVSQTEQTVNALRLLHPTMRFETQIIRTTGDVRVDVPLDQVGTKGMFVKELEEALLRGDIDVAVHSLKDMPSELPPGLSLAAVPDRADPRDALVGPVDLMALPAGARIGTGSTRRRAALLDVRPDLVCSDIRGNVDTRLQKLNDGEFEALILACAGLQRLGLASRIRQRLSPLVFVPAPGQGALALEVRTADAKTQAVLVSINHADTEPAVRAERAFQAALGGGCSTPAGAHAWHSGGSLRLVVMLARSDGSLARAEHVGSPDDAEAMGQRAAADVANAG